jgi:hypothetical protein
MRLVDLDPHGLLLEGRRVGFIFRSPLPGKHEWWQTCFVEKFYTFKGRDGTYSQAGGHAGGPDSQSGIIRANCPAAFGKWQPCNPDHQWAVAGGIEQAAFETLTVTPSLDGSAAGLWHGFITNGEIVGGI